MEKEIFTWKNWDIQDTSAFSFYDVELVRNIPGFLAGTKFDLADIDYERGTLQFSNYGPKDDKGHREIAEHHDFRLGLVIL